MRNLALEPPSQCRISVLKHSPALIEAITNRALTTRYHALLGGTNAGPALAVVLNDTNIVSGGSIRHLAISALGEMRREAVGALLTLFKLLADSDSEPSG